MKIFTTMLFLFIVGFSQAQEKGIIEGIVLDKQMNNEPLAFANITLKESNVNTTTNIDGAYALELKPGTYTLIFSFPGYEKFEVPNIIVSKSKITSIKNIAITTRKLALFEENTDRKEKK